MRCRHIDAVAKRTAQDGRGKGIAVIVWVHDLRELRHVAVEQIQLASQFRSACQADVIHALGMEVLETVGENARKVQAKTRSDIVNVAHAASFCVVFDKADSSF